MPTDVRCMHPWSHGTHRGDSVIPATFWSACQVWLSCTFSFTKAPCCLKLLIPASNAVGRLGDHCWIIAGMPAVLKQLIHALQIAAHKTLSAPESPLSLCYVTDRERRGEWNCAWAENLEHLLFRSMWETYFCVRFQSRDGRLKPPQSFWYILYIYVTVRNRCWGLSFWITKRTLSFVTTSRVLIVALWDYCKTRKPTYIRRLPKSLA